MPSPPQVGYARPRHLKFEGLPVLPATDEEIEQVRSYMEWQAPDLKVEFLQKVYSEHVMQHRHDVWDVHTNVDRWWVITNPTNLYSQEQFPNMDLAVTFHVGLMVRIPRSDRQKVSDIPIEPFAECARYLDEATTAVSHAEEVADYQAIGVRCREALLAFSNVAQIMLPWQSPEPKPQKANFKAWIDHICKVALAGEAQKDRRRLFRTLLTAAWDFANWLTHTKSSKWHDAEAAAETTGHAVSLAISAVIQHVRGVPPACPACGSHRLSPQRAFDEDDNEWERPGCTKCDWTGKPVRIDRTPAEPAGGDEDRKPPEGECVIPTKPLRRLAHPADKP